MDKEKEIEGMKSIICKTISESTGTPIDFQEGHCSNVNCNECIYNDLPKALINAGYGDVKQAVKEFAEKAFHLIHTYLDAETDYTPSMTCKEIFDKLFKEMYDHDK